MDIKEKNITNEQIFKSIVGYNIRLHELKTFAKWIIVISILNSILMTIVLLK